MMDHKHWLNEYNFPQSFLGAECNSTGLCYENKVYPLPEFTLPLSAPSIQRILLERTFLITWPHTPKTTPMESMPWCSEQTDDADKGHVSSSRQSFPPPPLYKSHQKHPGIPPILILKMPLATLHLSSSCPHTTVYANQRTDLLMPAPSQHPSFHKGAAGSPRDQGRAGQEQ